MSAPPRVSIGLPVHNGERFLRAALDSLLSQTLGDFELIVSDNASTDGTRAICLEAAARDPRIRYLRQPRNIGAPRNWNAVVRLARAPYFKWATANDECAPTMLAQCVEALERDRGAVLAQGRTCLVDEESGHRRPYAGDLALPEARPAQRLAGLYTRLGLNNGQCGVIRTAALRRTGLDRPYENGDFVLMAELALQGRFLVLPELLLFRRMGPATFTQGLAGEAKREFFDPGRRSFLGDRLRLHADMLRSVALARLGLGVADRLGAFGVVARGLFWEGCSLLAAPRSRTAAP